jgi:hypothetical protein
LIERGREEPEFGFRGSTSRVQTPLVRPFVLAARVDRYCKYSQQDARTDSSKTKRKASARPQQLFALSSTRSGTDSLAYRRQKGSHRRGEQALQIGNEYKKKNNTTNEKERTFDRRDGSRLRGALRNENESERVGRTVAYGGKARNQREGRQRSTGFLTLRSSRRPNSSRPSLELF